MYRITEAESIAPDVRRIVVEAPKIARKHLAGQFVIVRVTPDGERIPLTIAAADADTGLITLFVQAIGRTTTLMSELEAGDRQYVACIEETSGISDNTPTMAWPMPPLPPINATLVIPFRHSSTATESICWHQESLHVGFLMLRHHRCVQD